MDANRKIEMAIARASQPTFRLYPPTLFAVVLTQPVSWRFSDRLWRLKLEAAWVAATLIDSLHSKLLCKCIQLVSCRLDFADPTRRPPSVR